MFFANAILYLNKNQSVSPAINKYGNPRNNKPIKKIDSNVICETSARPKMHAFPMVKKKMYLTVFADMRYSVLCFMTRMNAHKHPPRSARKNK